MARCHRCGEPLRPGQRSCSVCGTGIGLPAMPEDPVDRLTAEDPGPSSVFLMPADRYDSPYLGRRSERDQGRLMVWLALGLAAVSLLSGFLYYLYYLRVGNEVTALLPRDTVAYARIGPTASIREAFHNLDVWANTRPVRARLRRYEQRLVSGTLLDLGINSALLDQLQEAVVETHLGVVQRLGPEQRWPFDVLTFFRLRDQATLDRVLGRIEPFFEEADSESGVPLHIRGSGSDALSLATFDGWLVFCFGSETTLRDVLRNRERGPSRTLNDDDGFRAAYRAHAHEAAIWAWARRDQLLEVALPLTRGQGFVEGFRQISHLSRAGELSGVGLAVDLRGGLDAAVVGLYGGSLDDLADQTGLQPKRTLAVIPPDAILAVAASIADPDALFSDWRGPVLRLIDHFEVVNEAEALGSDLNRLQAETGVHLASDVWPNFAGEVALAWLPVEGGLAWMMAIQSHNDERLLDFIGRVAREVFQPRRQGGQRVRYVFEQSAGLNRAVRVVERPGPTSGVETVQEDDALCWATAGSAVLIARRCDVVMRARRAEQSGDSLEQAPEVTAALAAFPERNTAVAVARLKALVEAHYGGPLPGVVDLISDDFLAAAALLVDDDRVEVLSNLSPLAMGFLGITAVDAGTLVQTTDHCRRLARLMCDRLPRAECAEFATLVAGNSPQACRTGLRTLENLSGR